MEETGSSGMFGVLKRPLDESNGSPFSNSQELQSVSASSSTATDEGGRAKPAKYNRGGRATRACEMCRDKKTRCFPSPLSKACLRCKTLKLVCSFVRDDIQVDPPFGASEEASLDQRLRSLENGVGEILRAVKSERHEGTPDSRSIGDITGLPQPSSLTSKSQTSFGLPSKSFLTSPFNSFGTSVDPVNHPLPIGRLFNPQMVVHDQDIISLGIISEQQAIRLLTHFRLNYNRWVSFPDAIPIEVLLDRIRRRCSLLLTVCCCVAIQYFDRDLKIEVYKLLVQKLQTELNQSLLVVPQTIEFMQALAVLAIYAMTLSDGDFVIDAWFYSSVALQHFATKDILGLVMSFDGLGPVTEFDEITAYRVWNHLCLVHLVNCVMSGRMCILDDLRVDLCRRTLDVRSSTNFDGRMIAEISFQLIIYNFIEGDQSLKSVEQDLKLWSDEWNYLFEQPTTQFVETGYHYGYLLVLYNWNYRKNSSGLSMAMLDNNNLDEVRITLTSCDARTLRRMIRHSLKIIDGLLVVKENSYFSYLSDQVLFYGCFASVMLAKILGVVEDQKLQIDVSESLMSKSIERLNTMAAKFKAVSMMQDDLMSKFANSIGQMLNELSMARDVKGEMMQP